jgi:hypothetical protein
MAQLGQNQLTAAAETYHQLEKVSATVPCLQMHALVCCTGSPPTLEAGRGR